MWRLTRYGIAFALGQVAGILSATKNDREEFVASVRETIHRLTEPRA